MPKNRVKRHAVTQPLDKPYRLIPLTQGQNAIVDTKDFDWLMRWNWQALWSRTTKSFYAHRWGNHMMHRAILKCGPREGDHINHNTLDNRRENLRKCTHFQNTRNTKIRSDNSSGFKGVSFHKVTDKWAAYGCVQGKIKHLGLFDSREDAARAYDTYAKMFYGEFATLNFPQ